MSIIWLYYANIKRNMGILLVCGGCQWIAINYRSFPCSCEYIRTNFYIIIKTKLFVCVLQGLPVWRHETVSCTDGKLIKIFLRGFTKNKRKRWLLVHIFIRSFVFNAFLFYSQTGYKRNFRDLFFFFHSAKFYP